LLTAGIEGGSRRKVEDEWSWQDWEAMSKAWQRTAPPAHISLHVIGMSLGVTSAPGQGRPAPDSAAVTPATPDGLQGLLGQGEIRAYNKPRKGFQLEGQDG
jgi:hypothetical protein